MQRLGVEAFHGEVATEPGGPFVHRSQRLCRALVLVGVVERVPVGVDDLRGAARGGEPFLPPVLVVHTVPARRRDSLVQGVARLQPVEQLVQPVVTAVAQRLLLSQLLLAFVMANDLDRQADAFLDKVLIASWVPSCSCGLLMPVILLLSPDAGRRHGGRPCCVCARRCQRGSLRAAAAVGWSGDPQLSRQPFAQSLELASLSADAPKVCREVVDRPAGPAAKAVPLTTVAQLQARYHSCPLPCSGNGQAILRSSLGCWPVSAVT